MTTSIEEACLYLETVEDPTKPPPDWFYGWVESGIRPPFVNPRVKITDFAWHLASSARVNRDWLLAVIDAGLFERWKHNFLEEVSERQNDYTYNILVKHGLIKNIPFEDFLEMDDITDMWLK